MHNPREAPEEWRVVRRAPRDISALTVPPDTWIAHKFTQPAGWYIGQVTGMCVRGEFKGKFKVKYQGQSTPEKHQLLKSDYGPENVWVVVRPPSGN